MSHAYCQSAVNDHSKAHQPQLEFLRTDYYDKDHAYVTFLEEPEKDWAKMLEETECLKRPQSTTQTIIV
jgi:hypothetical protein